MLTVPVGCQTKTFRMTFEMPADHVASVEAKGRTPFVVVSNDGPDEVMITFDAGSAAQDGPRPVRPNTATGSTLHGSKAVRLETGPGTGSTVRVEASRVSTLNLEPPRPAGPPGQAP
jgi:hypothetical protein